MSLDNLSPKTVKLVIYGIILFIIYWILAAIYHLPYGIFTNANEFYSIATAGMLLLGENVITDHQIKNEKQIRPLFWVLPVIHAIFWWNMSARWHFNPHSMDVLVVSLPESFIIPILLIRIDVMLSDRKHRKHHANAHRQTPGNF